MIAEADIDCRLAVAEEVILEAGGRALSFFEGRARLTVESKGAQDFVTRADRETEERIVARLKAEFPADGVLGEEGGTQAEGAATWVIDPIDGTDNFLRGLPLWCISIALVVDGDVKLGLIHQPTSSELFKARRGGGARCNGRRMRTSRIVDPKSARIMLGFTHKFGGDTRRHVCVIERLLKSCCEYSRYGSGALGLAYLADGRFEGYWEAHINSWDVLAGMLMVQEAGGRTSDFLANNGLANGNEMLAATPALWDFLSAAVRP